MPCRGKIAAANGKMPILSRRGRNPKGHGRPMTRLFRIIRGPWAVVAGGSLALLGLANLASTPSLLRQLPWRAAERPAEPLNWIADAKEYPPSLLRVPQRIKPVRLPLADLAPRPLRGY